MKLITTKMYEQLRAFRGTGVNSQLDWESMGYLDSQLYRGIDSNLQREMRRQLREQLYEQLYGQLRLVLNMQIHNHLKKL